MTQQVSSNVRADGLADILERVLDKGIVVTGDVAINLVGIELLTIKLRLMITTVDKAMELGINWWQTDPMLSNRAGDLEEENRLLRGRLAILEKRMADLSTQRDLAVPSSLMPASGADETGLPVAAAGPSASPTASAPSDHRKNRESDLNV